MGTSNTDTFDSGDPLDDGLQDLGLPISVQTFLWRQISPFIRPKLGKLHEASCMVSSFSNKEDFFFLIKNRFKRWIECESYNVSISVYAIIVQK